MFGVAFRDLQSYRLKVTDGQRAGPSLLEDHIAREKIHRFDHERIPGTYTSPGLDRSLLHLLTLHVERVVHARGAGAHGYFKVFDDTAKKFTYASVLTEPSRTTPVFVRFSTVQGSRGSAVSGFGMSSTVWAHFVSRILFVTSVASRQSSTPTKVTGILLETIVRTKPAQRCPLKLIPQFCSPGVLYSRRYEVSGCCSCCKA